MKQTFGFLRSWSWSFPISASKNQNEIKSLKLLNITIFLRYISYQVRQFELSCFLLAHRGKGETAQEQDIIHKAIQLILTNLKLSSFH